jgi:hypothetical protein
MNVIHQEQKFAFRRISDKKWLNIWGSTIRPHTQYSHIDDFFPSLSIYDKYNIQQNFKYTGLNIDDYELIPINITYTL